MENVADKLCWEGDEFKAEGRVQSRLESRGVFCLLYTCTDSEVLVLMKLFSGMHSCAVPEGGRWAVMILGWISRDVASYSDVKAKSGGVEPEVMVHLD